MATDGVHAERKVGHRGRLVIETHFLVQTEPIISSLYPSDAPP